MTTRVAPPDRRSPVQISAGRCPQRGSCYCCPEAVGKHSNCRLPHPARDRECSQPYPTNIPSCPERNTLTQEPPAGSAALFSCCVECGRVTARRLVSGGQWLPWCAGDFPAFEDA